VNVRYTTQNGLDELNQVAADSPRRRKNLNFHHDAEEPCHRLLNAIEPDSYVRPHRHLGETQDETALVVRGRLGVVIFDETGTVVESRMLAAGGETFGATVPRGVFHTFISLEPRTVFFEAKAGPYRPLGPESFAPWAPAEGAPEAAAWLEALRRERFGGGGERPEGDPPPAE